jgi:tRNA(Ile)-lysidine synthase TilS/MesJ
MAGIPVKKIKIVLTIAHIDHDTTNNADDNLAALCQRCHNRHDAPHRTVNAARTRERKRREAKVASGQQEMEL